MEYLGVLRLVSLSIASLLLAAWLRKETVKEIAMALRPSPDGHSSMLSLIALVPSC